MSMVASDMVSLLAPRQLGFGVTGGTEAAVHATRRYLNVLQSDHVILKLDFKNACNFLCRDKKFEAVQALAPDYLFIHSVYSSSSTFFWGEQNLLSAEGVQQGHPLSTLLFCLTLHQHCPDFSSELCEMHLDDITLGGLTFFLTFKLFRPRKRLGYA